MKKIFIITGTPGTGKTTILKNLEKELKENALMIDAGELAIKEDLIFAYDCLRKSLVIDIEALKEEINKIIELASEDLIVISSHYPCIADKNKVERVIVLRTSPEKLYDRLKNRGWEKRKIEENIDSEELSVILLEAKSCYGNKVIEINTDDDIATTMKKIFEALL
ncbi:MULTISPECIES: AAA family ATPase [Fervidicoccus]|nr:AAA family ATPase [Fervidicoccus fontis]PMB75972.1 MAG: hypothetical protein C0188_00850 [Fervidicoccus fontis]PMB77859.1 MAG: hypothetical protein C0177_01935 [Fervidicoccus fontis]